VKVRVRVSFRIRIRAGVRVRTGVRALDRAKILPHLPASILFTSCALVDSRRDCNFFDLFTT